MKIFLVNAVCGIGSTGQICEDIAECAIKRGNECTIFYGNGYSNYSHAIKMTSNIGVKIHAILARVTGLQGYFSTISTLKLLAGIDRTSPDIVHLHNLHGNYINVPVFLNGLKKRRIKTIITLHDCWFYTGKCTHYTKVGCYKWKKQCGRCIQLGNDIPSYYFDFTKKMIKDKRNIFEGFDTLTVIAVSEWIQKEAKYSILKNNNIELIPNWVDVNKFTVESRFHKNGSNEEFIILGVSAKWSQDMPKMQDFLKIAEKIPSHMKIRLVGEKVGNIKLAKNVEFIDFINDKNALADIFQEANIFLHLSREDSFGKVIIEAMSCGTPVIVYNSTACPELVQEGCGYVVEVDDIDGVVNRIKEVEEKGGIFYKDNCVNYAKKYSEEILVNQTIDLYEKLVES